jgi:hypothetical protein
MEADVSSKFGYYIDIGMISKKFELEVSVREVHGDDPLVKEDIQ